MGAGMLGYYEEEYQRVLLVQTHNKEYLIMLDKDSDVTKIMAEFRQAHPNLGDNDFHIDEGRIYISRLWRERSTLIRYTSDKDGPGDTKRVKIVGWRG